MFFASEPRFSKHARQRMGQRRIKEWEVFAVLRHGEYTVLDEEIRVQINDSERSLFGLVVVLSPNERVVVTVFWREEERDSFEVYRHIVGQSQTFSLGDQIREQLEKFYESEGEE